MLDQIYTQIIIENSRNSKHRGEIEQPTKVERGHNPNCGDDLTLMVKIVDDKISDARFIGSGCAISTASMSMMIDLVIGKTRKEAEQMAQTFLAMIQGEALTDDDRALLQDTVIFESLKDMPARAKCGTLGWHCLKVVVEHA